MINTDIYGTRIGIREIEYVFSGEDDFWNECRVVTKVLKIMNRDGDWIMLRLPDGWEDIMKEWMAGNYKNHIYKAGTILIFDGQVLTMAHKDLRVVHFVVSNKGFLFYDLLNPNG